MGDSKAFTVKTLGGRGTDYVTHTCWGRQLAGEQTAPGSCRDRVVRSPRGYGIHNAAYFPRPSIPGAQIGVRDAGLGCPHVRRSKGEKSPGRNAAWWFTATETGSQAPRLCTTAYHLPLPGKGGVDR